MSESKCTRCGKENVTTFAFDMYSGKPTAPICVACLKLGVQEKIAQIKENRMPENDELEGMPEKGKLTELAEDWLRQKTAVADAKEAADNTKCDLIAAMKEKRQEAVIAETPDGEKVVISLGVTDTLSIKKE